MALLIPYRGFKIIFRSCKYLESLGGGVSACIDFCKSYFKSFSLMILEF